MTNTPETDELRDDIWQSVYVEGQDFMQMLEHARTLERERDKLLRSCHIWQNGNAALVAERDRLAMALRMITTFDYSDLQCANGHGPRSVAAEALQSLTPNEP
jgi:hypothetical protein